MARIVILAEGRLGRPAGKTATGLILHGRDTVVAVIDSTQAGQDAGTVVAGRPRGIPVVADLEAALAFAPDSLAIGISPPGGKLPAGLRPTIRAALQHGLRVINGLHDFLGDDPEMQEACRAGGAEIWDVRRPAGELRVASGSVHDVAAPRLVVMGTDCESGKRVTAGQLVRCAERRGLRAAFVATGQTGCMIGADAGAVIDRYPADFAAGQVEAMVVQVAADNPDLIIVPGQGALHHPAYGGVSLSILQGAAPTAVVLQVVAGRQQHIHFPHPAYEIASVEQTIASIEQLGRTRVVALAINAQGVDAKQACEELTLRTGLPAFDALHGDVDGLLDVVLEAVKIPLVVA